MARIRSLAERGRKDVTSSGRRTPREEKEKKTKGWRETEKDLMERR